MFMAHLYSRTDWGQWVHLWEAHRLAVHGGGLLHDDGGTGLTLRPRESGSGSGSWFGLLKKKSKRMLYFVPLEASFCHPCFNLVIIGEI